MPLDQFAGELIGGFPGLDILTARNLVNKAWQDIREEGLWSWLSVSDAPLVAPTTVTAGLATVTQGSPFVVGDATAAAVWLTLALANPPLASPTLGQGRQFRLGQGAPIYNIIAFDGVNTLTLDRNYVEASQTSNYQIYRSYFAPPSTDFLRYMTITNIQFAYTITGKFLNFNQEQLNRMDPQRGSQGDAYINASYRADPTTGAPIYEMWPAPTNGNSYVASYQRRGLPLTPDGITPAVDLPSTLSTSLLMARAEYQTAQWAVKNINRYRDLAGINWRAVRQEALAQYNMEIIKARRQDFEIFKNTWIAPKGTYLGFPVDAAFMQSHDVDVMFGAWGGE